MRNVFYTGSYETDGIEIGFKADREVDSTMHPNSGVPDGVTLTKVCINGKDLSLREMNEECRQAFLSLSEYVEFVEEAVDY